MTQHQLQNRNKKELAWFQPRGAWFAAIAPHGGDIAELTAAAQTNNNGLLN